MPATFDQIIQSWDTANSPRDIANHSVCTTWGRKDKRVFLLHVYRQRVDYPDLKRAVVALAAEWMPAVILIEDKASGTQLAQELATSGLSGVKAVTPKGDKIMRLREQTITIERGDVWLPRRAAWLQDYVAELTSFPQCKHSDQVDSTTQALHWIAETGIEPSALIWIKQECARLGIAPPAF